MAEAVAFLLQILMSRTFEGKGKKHVVYCNFFKE